MGKCTLEKRLRIWLNILLLKRLGRQFMDPVNYLSRARNRDGVMQKGTVERALTNDDIYQRPTRFLRNAGSLD